MVKSKKRKKIKSWLQRIGRQYRVVVYDHSSHKPTFQKSLSLLRLYLFIAIIVIISGAISSLIIFGTPVKEFIPGYIQKNIRTKAVENYHRLDSLKAELRLRDLYLANIKNILNGEDSVFMSNRDIQIVNIDSIHIEPFSHDSIFEDRVKEERYNLSFSTEEKDRSISSLLLFPPIKGVITSEFNNSMEHFGIDIAAPVGAQISSILDGVVLMAEYTINTGYIIIVQHENNILSIYKHNSEILKRVGEQVKSGEIIALAGNSGEITSGSHLHFELWIDGKATNPQQYINF